MVLHTLTCLFHNRIKDLALFFKSGILYNYIILLHEFKSMEGMVNHTLPDRLVNHIHKTSRSISDTSFKHKDSVTILHDNDF